MKLKSKLVYFLSETHFFSQNQSLLVVNLVGALTKKNMHVFQDCQRQIDQSTAKWIVINFKNASSEMDAEFIPLLDQLRLSIYKKMAQFKFSGLHPRLKECLLQMKLAHPDELAINLADALQTFPVAHAAA